MTHCIQVFFFFSSFFIKGASNSVNFPSPFQLSYAAVFYIMQQHLLFQCHKIIWGGIKSLLELIIIISPVFLLLGPLQFSVFLGIIFFLELTAGILAFVFKDWLKDQLQFFINNNIRAYRDDIDLQNLIDFTQEYVSGKV